MQNSKDSLKACFENVNIKVMHNGDKELSVSTSKNWQVLALLAAILVSPYLNLGERWIKVMHIIMKCEIDQVIDDLKCPQ